MVAYQSIGFTKKTYGVKGEIKLNVLDDFLEDFAQAAVVFLAINGRQIPFFIEYINFDAPFVVKFEDYNSKEAAIELTGKEMFLRTQDLLPESEKVLEVEGLVYERIIGYVLIDKNLGKLGEIVEIIEFPQQEMAAILINEKEVLIPLNEGLILEILDARKEISMDLPDGLLDLD